MVKGLVRVKLQRLIVKPLVCYKKTIGLLTANIGVVYEESPNRTVGPNWKLIPVFYDWGYGFH